MINSALMTNADRRSFPFEPSVEFRNRSNSSSVKPSTLNWSRPMKYPPVTADISSDGSSIQAQTFAQRDSRDSMSPRLAQRLQAVKPLGIAMQHRVLVIVGEMLILDDLFDFMLAIFVIDLVRKVAGEHEGLVAHRFDQLMQPLFSALAADEDAPRLDMAANIVADLFARLELEILAARIVLDMGLPATVESF